MYRCGLLTRFILSAHSIMTKLYIFYIPVPYAPAGPAHVLSVRWAVADLGRSPHQPFSAFACAVPSALTKDFSCMGCAWDAKQNH